MAKIRVCKLYLNKGITKNSTCYKLLIVPFPSLSQTPVLGSYSLLSEQRLIQFILDYLILSALLLWFLGMNSDSPVPSPGTTSSFGPSFSTVSRGFVFPQKASGNAG